MTLTLMGREYWLSASIIDLTGCVRLEIVLISGDLINYIHQINTTNSHNNVYKHSAQYIPSLYKCIYACLRYNFCFYVFIGSCIYVLYRLVGRE